MRHWEKTLEKSFSFQIEQLHMQVEAMKEERIKLEDELDIARSVSFSTSLLYFFLLVLYSYSSDEKIIHLVIHTCKHFSKRDNRE